MYSLYVLSGIEYNNVRTNGSVANQRVIQLRFWIHYGWNIHIPRSNVQNAFRIQ